MPDVSLYPVDYDPFAQGSPAMYGDPTDYTPQAPLPAAATTAGQIGRIGASLASGHAAQDYQDWIDPTGANRNALSGFSAPAMVAGAADAVTNYGRFADDLQRGAYGDQPLLNQAAVDRGAPAAFDVAGLLGAGGMAGAEEGAAGIFGGRLSATADHAAADRAEQMLAQGASPGDVWKATGWFRGADGQMRYEIPDYDATLRGSTVASVAGRANTVGRAMSHPSLFDAYPDLANMRFTTEGVPERARGAYAPPDPLDGSGEEIRLSASLDGANGTNVGLHELQHAVQQREGFARGSSPETMQSAIDLAMSSRNSLAFKRDMDALPASVPWGERAGMVMRQYRDLGMEDALPSAAERDAALRIPVGILQGRASIIGETSNPSAYDFYRRTAGETEARNVQARASMDAQSRLDAAPWSSQDVPDERQITKYAGARISTDASEDAPLGSAGGNAMTVGKDDLLAQMHALLDGAPDLGASSRPMAETGIADPGASSWRLYHGTMDPTWDIFDPAKAGLHTSGAERGALFMSPREGEAAGYSTGSGNGRVLALDVTPGNTGVYDVGQLLATRDPRFMAASRADFTGHPQTYEDALRRFDGDVAYHEDLKQRLGPDHGLPDYPTASNLLHPQSAAVSMAREDGRDTAILRGLGESSGGDQIVALRPGFVRNADTGALVYANGDASASAGLTGLENSAPSAALDMHPRSLPLDQLASQAPDGHFLAYHGSPHAFDSFDISKVGTGEGLNYEGHGIYFAGDQDVAAHYADTYGAPRTTLDGSTLNGHMYQVAIPGDPADFLNRSRGLSQQNPTAQAALAPIYQTLGVDPQRSAAKLIERMKDVGVAGGISPSNIDRSIADHFAAQGIPGYRYQSAFNAEPNFVKFDPSDVRILKRYASGVPGLPQLAGPDQPPPSLLDGMLRGY